MLKTLGAAVCRTRRSWTIVEAWKEAVADAKQQGLIASGEAESDPEIPKELLQSLRSELSMYSREGHHIDDDLIVSLAKDIGSAVHRLLELCGVCLDSLKSLSAGFDEQTNIFCALIKRIHAEMILIENGCAPITAAVESGIGSGSVSSARRTPLPCLKACFLDAPSMNYGPAGLATPSTAVPSPLSRISGESPQSTLHGESVAERLHDSDLSCYLTATCREDIEAVDSLVEDRVGDVAALDDVLLGVVSPRDEEVKIEVVQCAAADVAELSDELLGDACPDVFADAKAAQRQAVHVLSEQLTLANACNEPTQRASADVLSERRALAHACNEPAQRAAADVLLEQRTPAPACNEVGGRINTRFGSRLPPLSSATIPLTVLSGWIDTQSIEASLLPSAQMATPAQTRSVDGCVQEAEAATIALPGAMPLDLEEVTKDPGSFLQPSTPGFCDHEVPNPNAMPSQATPPWSENSLSLSRASLPPLRSHVTSLPTGWTKASDQGLKTWRPDSPQTPGSWPQPGKKLEAPEVDRQVQALCFWSPRAALRARPRRLPEPSTPVAVVPTDKPQRSEKRLSGPSLGGCPTLFCRASRKSI